MKARAGRAKVVLELGGNAACIVDADQTDELDAVVDRLVFGGVLPVRTELHLGAAHPRARVDRRARCASGSSRR